jgi:hypothetical protein
MRDAGAIKKRVPPPCNLIYNQYSRSHGSGNALSIRPIQFQLAAAGRGQHGKKQERE